MGLQHREHAKNVIPDWYQYFTQANSSKFMPGWKPNYNLKLGTKLYKNYLLN